MIAPAWLPAELEAALRALGLGNLVELRGDLAEGALAALAGPPVTVARTRRLYRLPHGSGALYVKLQLAAPGALPVRKWPSYALKPSPLVREARAFATLSRYGFRTPSVLGAVQRGRFPATVRAALVTAEVPGHVDAERCLEGGALGTASRAATHAAIQELVARLHAAGLALGGARYRDFLVPERGARGPEDVLLIDVPNLAVGRRGRARDLRQLAEDCARLA